MDDGMGSRFGLYRCGSKSHTTLCRQDITWYYRGQLFNNTSRNTADFKAPFYPGAIYLLSLFYTRKEIALRIGVLYSANILATSFSGLIAAATFATLGGAQGLEGWRWLFIILGKLILQHREIRLTVRYRYGSSRHCSYLHAARPPSDAGFKQALTDPRLALFVLFQTLHMVRAFGRCMEWYTDFIGCLRVQLVLPYRGQDTGILHHAHSCYGKLSYSSLVPDT
jgi:MFS family permease